MVKIPKYKPKRGATADEIPAGKHTAVIRGVDTEIMQRDARVYDNVAKANVVKRDEQGNAIMEDVELIRIDYEITDIAGNPQVGDLYGQSMNPGDKNGNMRSKLYKTAMALDEVPENGDDLDTDRFIGREVEIEIVHKQSGETLWANVSGPVLKALDAHQRKLGSA